MIRRHNLKGGDYEKHSRFCQWFLHQYRNRRFLANFIIIGDEVGFTLNGAVNNHDVGMYAPANQPPDFYCNFNDNRQKLTIRVGLCRNYDMFGPFFGNVNE